MSSQEMVALCDEEGVLLFWNKAAEEVTGFRQDDVIGYHLDSIIAPVVPERAAGYLLNRADPGPSFRGSPSGCRPRSAWRSRRISFPCPRYESGKLSGWLLVFRDTTLKIAAPGAVGPGWTCSTRALSSIPRPSSTSWMSQAVPSSSMTRWRPSSGTRRKSCWGRS